MFRFLKVFFVFAVLLLSACGQEKGSQQDDSKEKGALKVYTTIYPLTFFTEEIGKEHVDVESILPAGVDEHTYEPTAKTIIDIADGDLFMYNGLGLEPFGAKVKKSMDKEGVRVVEVGEEIDLGSYDHKDASGEEEADHEHADEEGREEHGHEHAHGGTDPHIWLDPVLAVEMSGVIKDELSDLDPKHKEDYERNYEELKSKLMKLDGEFQKVAEQSTNKEFLVSHAAFGYWEKEYGFKQISVAGLSPTNEPSQKQLKEMIETARKHQIQYVIFEQNVTPKVAKVVQKELKAEALQIHNLSVLTEEDEAKGENYFTLMEHNVQTLKKAVGN
ncbi:zinc ABC transporter substrate-binding protein [Bacillus badius]|uniref:metal ABC transporter solute-binding protein, Zn/Mn family n=1 Tax=Bacillus badius TaxID=1455 RepID=UPI0007B09DAB|nr:zinc ABC transporter substrate-binding protein [Bacillus badius]KZO01843.1 adhesin [Bacillus badius]MED0667522.1 zinc ABC transporter substrate-binding protein [Bacillus badius]OCS90234.1 adhesin [Bacillus badius]OVE53764.1 adhesin [Bacillus badius]TDW06154.1 zinc transport system substrate-binding protein [Bacillus badius]